ncbi:cytochrome C [Sporosarcina sp. P31]|nr:cytochrome C [Sporosarcina sp. P29]PID05736.1 cytochrome C [Sporosarcina sp. P30]PID08930.1 cytochrome C [Sporosarcina sp. P31]PID12016.1 cytochrome C [Sporosarcina sp. P32b]
MKEGNPMNKNPVVPFLLIFALGIGLVFFMSLYGLDQKKEIAGANEEGTEQGTEEESANTGEFDAEAVAQQKCISCHGDGLTGGMGPALNSSLDADEVHDAIKNGVAGTAMPAGLVPDENIDEMVDYILSLD